MNVKEEKIKPLILKYQQKSDINILKQIIETTSNMIYNYPLVVFHVCPDECSDFYIYFIERIKPLILKYNPALSSFNTWFNILLKSQCLNWLNRCNNKIKKYVKTEPFSNDSQYLIPSDTAVYSDNKDDISVFIEHYIDNLDELDYLVIKLLYYDIDSNLLKKLSSYNKKNMEVNIELIKLFLNNNKKSRIQSEITDQISILQYKIFYMKNKSSFLNEEEKNKYLIRLKRYSSHLNILKKKLNHNLENFDMKAVAVILDEKQNEIYYRVTKIKNDLFIKLKGKITAKYNL